MDQQIAAGTADGLERCWSDEKGWGLQTKDDLPSGSLVFREDPSAAVLSTNFYCSSYYQLLPSLLSFWLT